MKAPVKRRALISLTDKSGAVEFARGLAELGYEVVSTGGTFRVIQEAGVPVVSVSDITGFPECLDGRVKTLHPVIHAGILAVRENPAHRETLRELDIAPIDVVAINLYPFKQTILKPETTLAEAVENIDIGGPTMLRAAAKNYPDVAVVVDPSDYPFVLERLRDGSLSREDRLRLAHKVFRHTAAYDALIAAYLGKAADAEPFPEQLTLTYEKVQSMRYGENPHQAAAFYREIGNFSGTLPCAEQLHGKELSYNNINDANGALELLKEFREPCAVAVKHANPCGAAVGGDLYEAYGKAYRADPVSIYGGILAVNREIEERTAEEIGKIFLEIVIAPSYTPEALELLRQKKNLRILRLPDITRPNTKEMTDMKKVAGGLLVQQYNDALYEEESLVCVTEQQPGEDEKQALLFAWRVVKHTKSNGIVLAKDGATVGIGPGQTNRITALELAIRYGGEKTAGSVMASDAFFPFSDCVEAAHRAGITAIIQPGGSIRDEDSIQLCNRYGISMLFTKTRHFKH